MDWISGIQNAINYIENNITENLDYNEIAKQAACSNFYFQRIFGILCGITLGEYIRNRRLTLAGSELSSSNIKVIDIALKYGYESPESFTRAFIKFHGITPSKAKKDGTNLKSFSKLSVQIILKGGSSMNYRVENKKSFKVLEKVEMHSIDDSQNKNTIPNFWERSHSNGTVSTLLSKASDRSFVYGICYNHVPNDTQTFDYSIAVLYDGNDAPEGFRINKIPERTWLVFEVTGPMPNAIQEMWHRICTEFFPTSNYEPTYEMDIEAYTAGAMTSPDYKSELWIPVKSK